MSGPAVARLRRALEARAEGKLVADEKHCSFGWRCPACGAGSIIKAQLPDLNFHEAVSLIARLHHQHAPTCEAWERIETFNLGGCPYFGPVVAEPT